MLWHPGPKSKEEQEKLNAQFKENIRLPWESRLVRYSPLTGHSRAKTVEPRSGTVVAGNSAM